MIATDQLMTAPLGRPHRFSGRIAAVLEHRPPSPLNMWLRYLRVGRWKSYVFGERACFMLSLVAKSALALQVFLGTLAG